MTLNFNEFYEQFWCFNLNGFKVQIATWCDLYAGQGCSCSRSQSSPLLHPDNIFQRTEHQPDLWSILTNDSYQKTQTRCRSRGSRSRCLHWPDPTLARDWLHRGHVAGPRPLIGPRCCYCYCQRYLECLHEWTKIKLGWQDAEKM